MFAASPSAAKTFSRGARITREVTISWSCVPRIVPSFSRLCSQPCFMPARIGSAPGRRPMRISCSVMVVLPPRSASVSVVFASIIALPSGASARVVKTSRSGGDTSRTVPPIGMSMSNGVPLGPCIVTKISPPGRASMRACGLVKPCGPHQRCRCLASVSAWKTSARGALNVRVTVNSFSSDGVGAGGASTRFLGAGISALPWFASDMALLLLSLEFLQEHIEALEPRFPELAVVLEIVRDVPERRGLERARAVLLVAMLRNEAGVAQDLQVPADGRQAHLERRRELVHGGGAVGEAREDAAPRGIGEGA